MSDDWWYLLKPLCFEISTNLYIHKIQKIRHITMTINGQTTKPATKKQSMGHTLGSVTPRLVLARSFGVITKGRDQDV